MCLNCCGSYSAFKSRYKALVDNIFPASPQDGLVKTNMEKLTFYALSSPEKLDRIGDYLAQRVARDLSRHRIGYVEIAMQAMDILLQACHAQSLNLFVESFLKIVQQLLENSDYKMQLLATSSFVKFANIEEDTPSYHRRYDFFVSKFSSLCHSSEKQPEIRCKLRIAGLCGIRGVIRKTVSDDLQVDIWDEHHMDKIVPSFLFNLADTEEYSIALMMNNDELLNSVKKLKSKKMNEPFRKQPQSKNLNVEIVQSSFGVSLDEESGTQSTSAAAAIQHPRAVAEECLRELMGRANYGNIRSVIKPVLKHLDNHQLWDEDNEFSIKVFKIIMYSIQSQHSYAVIQLLMAHLDEKTRQQKFAMQEPQQSPAISGIEIVTTKVRTGIVLVLSSIVAIAAAESIGPSVLEIINSLLNYLRNSIGNYHSLKSSKAQAEAKGNPIAAVLDEQLQDEKIFQNTVINTLGEFANNLPDFQKIEIMVFILNKVSQTDLYLQDILLKSLLKVSTKYKTLNMVQAFPSNFLNPLLTMSLAKDHQVRLTVQLIFHQLLDRRDNLRKLKNTSLSLLPDVKIQKAYRQDLMFFKKHGNEILLHLYENFKFANNRKENLNALYTTLALLCVELSTEDILVELLRVVFAIQDFAIGYFANGQLPAIAGGDQKDQGQLSSGSKTVPIVVSEGQKEALKLNAWHISSLHSIVASFLRFTSQLTSIPAFCAHTDQVIKYRNANAKHLLPEFNPLLNQQTRTEPLEELDRIEIRRVSKISIKEQQLNDSPDLEIDFDLNNLNEECLFSKTAVVEALRSSGHDTALLLTPFTPGNVVVDSKMTRSTSDLNSINVDVESVNSSPGLPRKHPGEEITFESLKKAFNEEIDQNVKVEKRIQLVEQYQTLPFEDLVNRQDRKSSDLQNRLNEIFTKLVAVKEATIEAKLNSKMNDLLLPNWSDIIINNII